MASFDTVNYSLRPGKSIQRKIIFDGICALKSKLGLSNMLYVGFGSVWFVDFKMAHELLDINDMISMERKCIGYRRAKFNKPYATVNVRLGESSDLLVELLDDGNFLDRSWVVWLDYDCALNDDLRDDIRLVIKKSPDNTIFLITFDGKADVRRYGNPKDRVASLRKLLGDVVPDTLCREQCKGDKLQDTLADLTINFMRSMAAKSMRRGGFVPAFRMIYKDSSPMVTVGGIIPSLKNTHDRPLPAHPRP